MKDIITKKVLIERTATYNKDMTKRYELTYRYNSSHKKEKAILFICMNPSSNDILLSDTTSNYILNNILPMGFTTITICNLFAYICKKIKVNEIVETTDNMEYIQSVLEREFHTIVVGYGNAYDTNKKVLKEKYLLEGLLKKANGHVVELIDKENKYSRLKTIHPLFAGQRFPSNWSFRKHYFENKDKTSNDQQNFVDNH